LVSGGISFDREIDHQHWSVPGFDNRPILVYRLIFYVT